jgi:hypothetical protein
MKARRIRRYFFHYPGMPLDAWDIWRENEAQVRAFIRRMTRRKRCPNGTEVWLA